MQAVQPSSLRTQGHTILTTREPIQDDPTRRTMKSEVDGDLVLSSDLGCHNQGSYHAPML